VIRNNAKPFTLEGWPIANRVVKPFIIKLCFHYKFVIFILKIQGHTCFPTLLHAAFINFGLVGWTSKNLHMNHNWKHNNKIPTSICNYVINNKLQHYFWQVIYQDDSINHNTWQNNCCKHDFTNVLQLQFEWNID
jgi:hypothetical protein